jgi:hypothetical protein
MAAGNNKRVNKLYASLINIIDDFLDRRLPLRRIIIVASLLKDCNIEIPPSYRIQNRLVRKQKDDGGWIDCEDTAWSLFYLSDKKKYENKFKNGLLWLESERNEKKGWGFCKRDQPCIPITAQILYLLSQYHLNHEACKWLENEWRKDILSPFKLNYKAAWYLLAYKSLVHTKLLSEELFNETIHYLVKEQRNGGSWGPWKNHPAKSDCFITGICMGALALSYSLVEDKIIIQSLKKGIHWAENNQLNNGLFPTHYIEEGSSWIFWGWSKTIDVLNGRSL